MREELKKAFKNEVAGVYRQEDFDNSINALSDFIFLICNSGKLKEENLFSMITGNIHEQRSILSTWGNIEIVLKELYRTIDPEKYLQDGGDKVKLEFLYKEVFCLVPKKRNPSGAEFSINVAKPERAETEHGQRYRHIKEFVYLYQFRNGNLVHGIDEASSDEIRKAVKYTCVSLLWLSLRHSSDLHKKALFETFSRELSTDWLTNCDFDYQNKMKNIGYVDFLWSANEICSTEQIAFQDSIILKDEYYIKLLGQAGSGKTTALLNINHLIIQKYETNGWIPVFYELKNLSASWDYFLKHIVADRFSVSEKAAECLLESQQRLIFLFDGYNEILNVDIRRRFAQELEQYTDNHRLVRVIMTDRNNQNEITVLRNKSKSFRLCSLTDENRKEYFKKNCKDTKILKLLLDTLEKNSVQFEMLTTPIKLYYFTRMTERTGVVPQDFTAEYLQELFERERDEKKDTNLDVLEDYLEAITLLTGLENEPIEKSKILAVMSRVDNLLGYKDYNTLQALRLARDMGILREENKKLKDCRREKTFYQFEDSDFLVYYNDLLYENEVLALNLEADIYDKN